MQSITIIHDYEEFIAINTTVIRELIIPNNTCNDQSFTEMDLRVMNNLERICIGENSLQSVTTVLVADTSSLRSIYIGSNSFSSSSRRLTDESESSQFMVMNCSSLNDIVVADYSFSNYHDVVLLGKIKRIELRLDLPSLSELRIGYHSFDQVDNITLLSLPLLIEAFIDERGVQTSLSSFTEAFITHEHAIYLHNNITHILLPSNQFNSLTHIHMIGFPFLQVFQIGSSSFVNLTSFQLSNLPSLQVLSVGGSSLYWLSELIMESMSDCLVIE